jgi:sulfite exporter TauE/SafE/copper chaperone CopZ
MDTTHQDQSASPHAPVTLHVHGMHCAACELFIQKKLAALPHVASVAASLAEGSVTVAFEKDVRLDSFLREANRAVGESGYAIRRHPAAKDRISPMQLLYAFLMAAVVMGAFLMLQKLGIARIIGGDAATPPVAFMIGVVASLSSCMAVVGGLVLSLSSTYAKAGNAKGKLLSFHAGRVLGFFALGGALGAIGSAFRMTPSAYFAISAALFAVMLVLGMNLLDVFPFLRKFQLSMPAFLSRRVLAQAESARGQGLLMPLVTGAMTFFLPCGFTQSMQFAAMASGSVLRGAVLMLAFALGTLPVLSLISLGSVRISKSLNAGLFFKTAGFIVIMFAVLNFMYAMVAYGIISPFMPF